MAERQQITLQIEGMTCDGCAGHVRKALTNVDGVHEVRLPTWQAGKAETLVSTQVTDEALMSAVEQAGYRALVREKRPVSGEQKIAERAGADYDLMIIGGGSAAFAAAIKGAELGATVAIVEESTIGGTCVNIGCVPSKTLIRAAEHCYHAAYSQFAGLTACPPPSDWRRVIAQKDELVAALRQGKYVDVAAAYPTISILRGHAELMGGRSVAIEGRLYTPGKIIVATGSRPWTPPIPGLAEAGFLDSTDALSLPELPASLIVIGAGAIGLELAQLFGRFGVKVTILEAGPRIAPLEEPEIGDALCGYLADEKVSALCNTRIERVSRAGSGYVVEVSADSKKHILEAAQLLVAAGRRPHTTGFGLERAGVKLGKQGEIVVDQHLRTTNPDIFAAGDCIGNPMYVYVAAYAGGLAAENALTDAGRLYDLLPLPRVTFTDPQIASVGLTEAQAKANGKTVKTALLPLSEVPRAIAARNTKGLIKLVAEAESGKLLGAHILAAEAGEVIQEATLAIRFGLRVRDLVETFHPYLTMAEGLKLAALTFQKDVKRLSCCAA
ncbi:MAG: mercury(II) reductase [Thermodesulfobacteriota bacterium]